MEKRSGCSNVAMVLAVSVVWCLLLGPMFLHASEEGAGSSGGGDSTAAQVAQAARRIDAAFETLCSSTNGKSVDVCRLQKVFKKVVEGLSVKPTKEKILDHNKKEREAGNDGKSAVIINPEMLNKMMQEPGAEEKFIPLLAHELMVLAGGEKNDAYTASGALSSALKAAYFDYRLLAGPLAKFWLRTPPQQCSTGGCLYRTETIFADWNHYTSYYSGVCTIKSSQGIVLAEVSGEGRSEALMKEKMIWDLDLKLSDLKKQGACK
jgi:hypothetical protein